MLIWLLLLLIFALLGVTGYYKGAIRATVSLIGLILALFLTLPLARTLEPLTVKAGLTNPLWNWAVAPLTVFLLFVLVFGAVGFVAHRKVAAHFKYATDDYTRIRWERLNQRLGLGLGLVAGGIYAVLVGLIIYIFGYPFVSVTGDTSPTSQAFLASARRQLRDLGLDRTLASLDPMHPHYYLASDIIGLIYQNPPIHDRLLNYPAFLALAERPEFKDILTDTELLNSLQTKAPILTIANHPKIQTVLRNAEIGSELKRVDLKDLFQYLKTAQSAKYDEEKILGRWQLDVAATFTLARKKNPEMTAKEMSRIRTLITVFLPKVSMFATPDNRVQVKMEMTDEANKMIEAAKAAVAAAAAAQQAAEGGESPGMTLQMMQRYGLRRPPGAPPTEQAAQPEAQAKPQALPGIPDVNLNGQGTWAREGIGYRLKVTYENGKETTVDCTATEDTLLVPMGGQALVFVRVGERT